jgi:diacylglycerol kinase (ATP)
MRVLLLHNPTAGDGAGDRRDLLALLRRHGYQPSYQSTKQAGWKRALRRRTGLLVVAGGDGTVAKVLRRLDAESPPLAILPSGSANNIALSLGIGADHEAWVRQWPRARLHPFARPQVRVDGRRRLCIEAVGLGVFPTVIAAPDADSANGEAKVAHGTDALLAQLRTAQPRRWWFELDGVGDEVEAIMLELLNVPLIGPRLNLSPGLQPGSGQVELIAVPASRRDALIDLLRDGPAGAADRSFVIGRARQARLAPACAPLHVDDKLWPRRIGRDSEVEVLADMPPVRLLRPDRGDG